MRPAPPLLLAAPTRFAGLSRPRALVVIGATVALVAVALTAVAAPLSIGPAAAPGHARITDLQLYAGIVEAMRHGDPYYAAAADALRAGGYPLRPFVAFRLPTLAAVQALLPPAGVALLLWTLVAAVLVAWWRRLAPAFVRPGMRAAAGMLLLGGSVAYWQADLAPFHELWAGLFVALSLAMRSPGRWIEAAAFGLAAMLLRETAALYVVVMAGAALVERDSREALGWIATLALFGVVVAIHAHAVAGVVRPLDPASPGWTGLLGAGFFVRALVTGTALTLLPLAVAAPLVALLLLGWAAWRAPLAARMTATLVAYAALLALFARPDTFYWVMLVAPASLAGLAFVPDAIRDLARAALYRPRITVRRVTR